MAPHFGPGTEEGKFQRCPFSRHRRQHEETGHGPWHHFNHHRFAPGPFTHGPPFAHGGPPFARGYFHGPEPHRERGWFDGFFGRNRNDRWDDRTEMPGRPIFGPWEFRRWSGRNQWRNEPRHEDRPNCPRCQDK